MTINEEKNLDNASLLVQRFVVLATRHGDATEHGNSDVANLAYKDLNAVVGELTQNDGRQKLVPLLNHTNPTVRAAAAFHTYKLNPERSKRVLHEVALLPSLIGFSAEMTLQEIKAGRLTPS
jgi:hypothetical protein